MAYHAKLSPSGADRWMRCPGSVVLSEGIEDTGSSYADEGTAAHFLAAWCLTHNVDTKDFVGKVIAVLPDGTASFTFGDGAGGRLFTVDDDMARYVQGYLASVRRQAEGGVLLAEQKVPLSTYTGEADATGSADAIVVTHDGELQVHDLKYGAGKAVIAEGNNQLRMYALGAVEALEMAYDFNSVRVFIHQPRIFPEASEWAGSLADLEAFGAEVRAAASNVGVAQEATQEIINNGVEAEWGAMFLNPGESQCQWCLAKATCPALSAFVAETVGAEFEDLDAATVTASVAEASPDDLSVKMSAAPLIEQWIKAVRAKVESDLLAGVAVPGYKLVQGKLGNRQWADIDQAEALLKSMRLKVAEMYDLKLISPTSAEKLLAPVEGGKPAIGPKQWKKVQEIIVRKEGGLSVAPASDKREAVNPAVKAADFDDLGDDLV